MCSLFRDARRTGKPVTASSVNTETAYIRQHNSFFELVILRARVNILRTHGNKSHYLLVSVKAKISPSHYFRATRLGVLLFEERPRFLVLPPVEDARRRSPRLPPVHASPCIYSFRLTTCGRGGGHGSCSGLIQRQHIVPQLCPTVLTHVTPGNFGSSCATTTVTEPFGRYVARCLLV